MRSPMSRILLVIMVLSIPASAEIEKTAVPTDKGIQLYWWPKLKAVAGWHQDRKLSNSYGINAQAPDGYTFANAAAVIYAKADYKPRMPGTKSLEMLITGDKQNFRAKDPTVVISEVDPLKTGDGKSLRSFTFFPKEKKGDWEQVSYGEEGDFYLVFVVSSKTKEAFAKAVDAYKTFISQYKEKF